VTTLGFISVLIAVFMFGMVFGVIILPNIIHRLNQIFLSNSQWAEKMIQKSSKRFSKRIRKGQIFQDRLKSILEGIKLASKDGNGRLVITSMRNCLVDKEIRVALRERNFMCDFEYEGKNTLRISWNGSDFAED